MCMKHLGVDVLSISPRDLANIISGGFTFDDIPNIPASKITSGTIDNARISLDAAEIPDLNTSKITAGTLDVARVPDMNASKITAGTFPDARLPSTALNSNVDLTTLNADHLTSGTVADARLPSTALNSNVDLTNLSASNMTSGTLPDARFPSTLPAISAANLTNLPASQANADTANLEGILQGTAPTLNLLSFRKV